MNALSACLLLLLCSIGLPAAANDLIGKVIAVTDGDTIKLIDVGQQEYKIRLTGIDAPERGQPWGNASRQHLASLLAGKTVRVESSKIDRYGRILGKVWVSPPDCPQCDRILDANLAQIVAGMAWWYQYYASEQVPADRERYKNAVAAARKANVGLWREPAAIPPWAWRRGQRTTKAETSESDLSCGSKRYCRQMNSCREAQFHFQHCRVSTLDGDGDGVPCESLCR